jgi:type I restriction enzyme S subunit
MTDDWRRVTIGEIGRIVTGKTPSTKRPELYGDRYPFITPSDIVDYYDSAQPTRYLSEEGYRSQQNLLLPARAICYTCIASIGKICITSEPSFTNQQINSIIVDGSRHDYRFIYHLLREETKRIVALASGAATPIINKSMFSQIAILVPSLETQRQIGAFIEPYDLLIENCRKRSHVLRRMRDVLLPKLVSGEVKLDKEPLE